MSSDQSFQRYFVPIMSEYEKLARDIGISDETDVSLWCKFCATISDHAADQKKWNQAFLDMVTAMRGPDSAGKVVVVMLFCGMHRAQIASRDVATEFSAWSNNQDFDTEKSGKQRYDDFKDPVHLFIANMYSLMKDEHAKVLFLTKIHKPLVPLQKVTQIRFCTFDINAYHICNRWEDLKKFLPTLVNRSETKELATKVLQQMQDPSIHLKIWLLGVGFQKFFEPHVKVLEKHPSNIDFNKVIVKTLPKLQEMAKDPKRFYETDEKVKKVNIKQ